MRRIFPTQQGPLTDAALRLEAIEDVPEGPFVRFTFISSLDGAATLAGRSGGLGTTADHRQFEALRASCDAVVVGSGTIKAEGYAGELLSEDSMAWRRERGLPPRPHLVILSDGATLSPDSPALTEATSPVVVMVSAAAPAARRRALGELATVLEAGGEHIDPVAVVRLLAERGLKHINAEGGPHVLAQFVAADAVDALNLTLSPVLAPGPQGRISAADRPIAPLNMELHRLWEEDGTVLTEYRRARRAGSSR